MVYCNGEGCDLHSDGTVSSFPSREKNENTFTRNLKYGLSPDEQCFVNSDCGSQCIQAHENLIKVTDFIQNTLGHKWQRENFLSNINYLEGNYRDKNYNYACWDYNQAFFGQHSNQQGLISLATSLDIITHEFFHGVSEQIAEFAYAEESGALDESYSDIFAILLTNFKEPDISKWQWELGKGFGRSGEAIRDVSQPRRFGQPEIASNFLFLDDGEKPDKYINDNGYVHHNSGIHNKAAYELLVSKDAKGEYLFDAVSGAKLFYKALSRLKETQSFKGSRSAITLAAKNQFRGNHNRQDVLDAIDRAFSSVGIIA